MDSIENLLLPGKLAAAVNRLATRTAIYQVDAQSTVAYGEIDFWQAPVACTITAAKYVPSTGSAPASGSNYQTLLITRYTGTAGTGATVASASFSNGSPLVAHTAFSLGTLVTATMTAGCKLSFQTALTGTATLPTGFVEITYTVD